MRFQVGRFTCELSRDDAGKVVTIWFRRAEPPDASCVHRVLDGLPTSLCGDFSR